MRHCFLVLIAVTLLYGCSFVPQTPGTVESNVAIFHQLTPSNAPTKYAFTGLKNQKTMSLEYNSYRDMIRNQLSKRDFIESPDDDAEFYVVFDYWIGPGKEELVSARSASRTIYERRLVVMMAKPPLRKDINDLNFVYQADVRSVGVGQVAAVMPNMIDALFEEFPGKSGSTRTVHSMAR